MTIIVLLCMIAIAYFYASLIFIFLALVLFITGICTIYAVADFMGGNILASLSMIVLFLWGIYMYKNNKVKIFLCTLCICGFMGLAVPILLNEKIL
ncbi:hypothetical protein ACXLT2_001201 [Campylobacter coli]|nr:hypothetical protein [Campylobacter coli]EHD2720742.1 hypothetical protein [Campylobacter coli]